MGAACHIANQSLVGQRSPLRCFLPGAFVTGIARRRPPALRSEARSIDGQTLELEEHHVMLKPEWLLDSGRWTRHQVAEAERRKDVSIKDPGR